jgi:hypothetical protein
MEGCCEGSQGPPRTVELEIIIMKEVEWAGRVSGIVEMTIAYKM